MDSIEKKALQISFVVGCLKGLLFGFVGLLIVPDRPIMILVVGVPLGVITELLGFYYPNMWRYQAIVKKDPVFKGYVEKIVLKKGLRSMLASWWFVDEYKKRVNLDQNI